MSTQSTPGLIVFFVLTVAVGNLLAAGAHSVAWWLRRKALLLTSILGGLAFLVFLFGIYCFCSACAQGSWFNIDGTPPPANWRSVAAISIIKTSTIFLLMVFTVGVMQRKQVPTTWFAACLCFCFEFALAIFIWQVGKVLCYTTLWRSVSFNFSRTSIISAYDYAFLLSWLALAFFRTVFLNLLTSVRVFMAGHDYES